MAITEDGSTPAVAGAVNLGSGTTTTASFSPPAGSLLVAIAGSDFHSGTLAITMSDSTGGTWTTGVNMAGQSGRCLVSIRYLASAPGSMTVSAAFTTTGSRFLAVRVLTGVNATQTGANSGTKTAASGTAATFAITSMDTDAVAYGCSVVNSANRAFTPNAATTVFSTQTDASNGSNLVAWRSTSPGAGAAVTYGGTWASTGGSNIGVGLEILPGAGGGPTGPETGRHLLAVS